MTLHILIADDSATNRLLFSTVVTRMGYQVDVAASGREALDLAARQTYDLVFLDLNMPHMSGLQAAKEILTQHNRRIPVYAISGYIAPETADGLLTAGLHGWLEKPLDRQKILQVIRTCGLDAPRTPSPDAQVSTTDVPRKLMGVYAQELRARGDACLRYAQMRDHVALHREAHTIRALAEMLHTKDVEDAAARIEWQIPAPADHPLSSAAIELPEAQVRALQRACHTAASIIERLLPTITNR